jgi:hypothetical protein
MHCHGSAAWVSPAGSLAREPQVPPAATRASSSAPGPGESASTVWSVGCGSRHGHAERAHSHCLRPGTQGGAPPNTHPRTAHAAPICCTPLACPQEGWVVCESWCGVCVCVCVCVLGCGCESVRIALAQMRREQLSLSNSPQQGGSCAYSTASQQGRLRSILQPGHCQLHCGVRYRGKALSLLALRPGRRISSHPAWVVA